MGHRRAPLAFGLRLAQAAILPAFVLAQDGGLFSACGPTFAPCVAGTTCVVQNSFYAQCLAASNADAGGGGGGGAEAPPTSPPSDSTIAVVTPPPLPVTSPPTSEPTSTPSASSSTAVGPTSSSLPRSSSATSQLPPPSIIPTASSPSSSEPPFQAVAGAVRTSSFSGGKIAGIALGAIAVLLVVVFAMCYTYRRRRRIRTALVRSELFQRGGPLLPIARSPWEKNQGVVILPTGSTAGTEPSPSSAHDPEKRQAYLKDRILAAQRELAALNADSSPLSPDTQTSGEDSKGGTEQGRAQGEPVQERVEAMQERICTLEAQLHSQWAIGLSDEPPPGYVLVE